MPNYLRGAASNGLAGHHGQVPAAHNKRRCGQRPGHHAHLPARRCGQRPDATIENLRRTTSVAAGDGLGITINYVRRTTSAAAGSERPGHHDQVTTTHNERRRGQRPGAAIKYMRRTTSAQRSSTCAAPWPSVWETRPSSRAVPRPSDWAPPLSPCVAKRAPLRATAWVPRPSTF
jgi:hypothetical protein